MKFLSVVLLAMAAAHSAEATEFCLDFVVQDHTHAILASARCDIDQITETSLLMGDWTCSFNQGPVQTNKMLATWITDPKPEQAATLVYSVNPGLEIGDFLFLGMGLHIRTGADIQVILGDKPSIKYNNASLMDEHWNSLDFKAVAASYGKCAF